MSIEDELLQSYLTDQGVKLTYDQFQIGMMGLVEKGLVEMKIENGKKMYRPTPLMREMKTHLHSDAKARS